ncbi:MAG: CbiQ family ECF transporter T component [Candidatus Eisenbacteria bacterium]
MSALAQIDYQASTGRSPWHRASALSKLLLALLLVASAIAAPSLRMLLAMHAVAWLLVLTSGLPPALVAAAAGCPLVFTVVFVLTRWDGTWLTPLMLVLRPVTASLTAAWLTGTTPYPDLFAPISRVLPRHTGDSLFLTYRALWALLDRADQMWRALQLRGGLAGPARRRMTVVGEGLGLMVVHGFERSRRLYATMQIRGHSGRVCGCRHWAEPSAADLLVAAAAVLIGVLLVFTWGRR